MNQVTILTLIIAAVFMQHGLHSRYAKKRYTVQAPFSMINYAV